MFARGQAGRNAAAKRRRDGNSDALIYGSPSLSKGDRPDHVVRKFHARWQGEPSPEETTAAIKIQKCWKGKQARLHREKRKLRAKPFGFYTHSLALARMTDMGPPPEPDSALRAVYLLMEDPSSSKYALALSYLIVLTIVGSIGCFVFETVPDVYRSDPHMWLAFEVLSTSIFTAEYVCRVLVCKEGGITRCKFVLSPLNVFDLVALMPFYIEVAMRSADFLETSWIRILRLIRLTRVVRILKLGRYASGMRLMGKALVQSSQPLSVLVFVLVMGVVLFSSAVYHVERMSCPTREDMDASQLLVYQNECADSFYKGWSPSFGLCCTEHSAPNDFPSIVAAAWWSMVTMTSVGYGDIYPRTFLGKCVGCINMFVGVMLIALPVAIVGKKFQDVYETHDFEEAKKATAQKMKDAGEACSLVPPSDVLQRLRGLRIADPKLVGEVADLASYLERMWEDREQLEREYKSGLLRSEVASARLQKLLTELM